MIIFSTEAPNIFKNVMNYQMKPKPRKENNNLLNKIWDHHAKTNLNKMIFKKYTFVETTKDKNSSHFQD